MSLTQNIEKANSPQKTEKASWSPFWCANDAYLHFHEPHEVRHASGPGIVVARPLWPFFFWGLRQPIPHPGKETVLLDMGTKTDTRFGFLGTTAELGARATRQGHRQKHQHRDTNHGFHNCLSSCMGDLLRLTQKIADMFFNKVTHPKSIIKHRIMLYL